MAWYIFQPEGAVAPAPHIDPRRAEAAASEWVGARHAILPPAPMGALAIGQSDLHPVLHARHDPHASGPRAE